MRKVKCRKRVGNNAGGTTQGSARLWAAGKSKLIQIAAHVHLASPGQRDSRMPHTLSSPESWLPHWFQSLATAATRQWRLQSTQRQKYSPPPCSQPDKQLLHPGRWAEEWEEQEAHNYSQTATTFLIWLPVGFWSSWGCLASPQAFPTVAHWLSCTFLTQQEVWGEWDKFACRYERRLQSEHGVL